MDTHTKTKKCNTCGVHRPVTAFSPHQLTKDRLRGECKDCSNRASRDLYHGSIKHRASAMLTSQRSRARTKNIPFSLDLSWFFDQYEAQSAACYYTKIPFFLTPPGAPRSPWTMSIDRTDSRLGYTPDNAHLTSWIYNGGKGEGTHQDVIKFCIAMVENEGYTVTHDKSAVPG